MQNEDIAKELKEIKSIMNNIGLNNADINYRINLLIMKLEDNDEFYSKLVNLNAELQQNFRELDGSELNDGIIKLFNETVKHIRSKEPAFLKYKDLTGIKYDFSISPYIERINGYMKDYVQYYRHEWP